MKNRLSTLIPGLILILIGGLALASQFGYFEDRTPQFWMAAFAGVSVLFLLAYLTSGVRSWGWLFPTLIAAAIALTIYLGERGLEGSFVGMPILLGVGLPFLVPFASDVRKNWWALIPAWIMFILAAVVGLADYVQGEWIAALVLFGFALPFFVVYLFDRSRWWALIPGFALGVIGVIPIMTVSLKGEYAGGLINILIGLPFLAAYLMSRRAWWALIPAGVMISIGLMIILIGVFGDGRVTGAVAPGVMFLGWAATFGVLWLRRDLHSTHWAKYPAIVLAGLGLIVILGSAGFNFVWPVILIGGGLLLLYFGFRRKPTELKP